MKRPKLVCGTAAITWLLPLYNARAADVPPDLTGLWSAPIEVHPAGFPMIAGVTTWAGISKGDPRQQHVPTMDEIRARTDKIAAALKAAHGDPRSVPLPFPPVPVELLTPAGRTAAAAFKFQDFEKKELGCYPFNVLWRVGGGLGALEIVQNPRALMMATEINGHNFPRIIYLDGRTDANALPNFEGYSVGKWQGATLHLTTTHMKGEFFNMNWPLSESATLSEDYSVSGTGAARKLEIVQRIDDPANYREALTRVSYLAWRPDLELHDFPCEEGKDDQVEVTTHPGPPDGPPGDAPLH